MEGFYLSPNHMTTVTTGSKAATKEGGVHRIMEINKSKFPFSSTGNAQNVLAKKTKQKTIDL